MAPTAPDTLLREFRIPGGVDLLIYPTAKFKTTLVEVLLHRELDESSSTAALVPYLLRRGTRSHPDMVSIARHLEKLFGASLDVDVRRFGERQSLCFRLDVVDDRYLFLGGRDLLRQGLALLREVLLLPAMEGERFPAETFLQERTNLRRFVDSLANDKGRYALDRCIRHMCAGEPYARSEYGEAEEIGVATPEDAARVWRETLQTAPMEIYVVGSCRPERVVEMCTDLFGGIRNGSGLKVPRRPDRRVPRRIRRVVERDDVVQARLVMGFRTDIAYGDRRSACLAVWNSIFGSGPFCRLFKEVRERRSLAYYCSSHADQSKGVLFVQSGIDGKAAPSVIRLVRRLMGDMARKGVTLEELRAAKAYLRGAILSTTDSAARIAGFLQERRAVGSTLDLSQILTRLRGVRRREVTAAGASLAPDTYYLLAGGGAG